MRSLIRVIGAGLLGLGALSGCDQPIPGADEDMVEPEELRELEEGRRVDQEVTHVSEPPQAEVREAREAREAREEAEAKAKGEE